MSDLLVFSVTLGAGLLIIYGIKKYFDYKQSQGSETSNAPVRGAIFALLTGFLVMVGLSQLVVDMIAQLLNSIPGVDIKGTQSSELIGLMAYAVFCISVLLILFFYYRNRHRLYHGTSQVSHTSDKQKNIVKDSQLSAGRDIHIGDRNN